MHKFPSCCLEQTMPKSGPIFPSGCVTQRNTDKLASTDCFTLWNSLILPEAKFVPFSPSSSCRVHHHAVLRHASPVLWVSCFLPTFPSRPSPPGFRKLGFTQFFVKNHIWENFDKVISQIILILMHNNRIEGWLIFSRLR